jgi:hypothetical protein
VNVEEKERDHQTLSASVWGLGTLWLSALVEQGFEPIKGIAQAINCRRNCLVFSRRSEALLQSVKSGRVAKTMPWRRPGGMSEEECTGVNSRFLIQVVSILPLRIEW